MSLTAMRLQSHLNQLHGAGDEGLHKTGHRSGQEHVVILELLALIVAVADPAQLPQMIAIDAEENGIDGPRGHQGEEHAPVKAVDL